ncbi:unnamed protein product [Paramecium octaurelia]|uniref:Dynein light chain n=1 Tax=Paramecium octaurelia TaxID=43137 RepID=A0A8S1W7S1_PAROT|nr:unnamed protein product [Paramecium octaurelia]
MADDGGADKGEYIGEEVAKAIDDGINAVFQLKEGENPPAALIYSKEKVISWSNQLLDYTNRNLSKLDKPFKYCVSCIIQQNNDSKFTVALGASFDTNTDGICSAQREINDIVIIISVFAMLI